MDAIFKDLKVVELAGVLAGPAVGMFFSELGAKVTKVENPHSNGDVTRSWRLPEEDNGGNVSAYFSSINYKKEYRLLDMKNEEEMNQIKDLISEADILITNHKKGKDIEFGLTYEELSKTNPRLIHAHLDGFESNESRTAYDVVLQAEAGYMFMNGTQESGPLKIPLAMIDVLAAQELKAGILIGLWEREKTGKGKQVLCSLERAAYANLINQASNYLMCGFIPKPIGSLHPNIAPYGETFECKDGKHIVLAVGSNRHFQKLCGHLGLGELPNDPKFETNLNRVKNRTELYQTMINSFKSKNRDEWMEIFIENQIPAGSIKNMKEVFENPVAQSMVRTERIEGIDTKRVSSIGFKLLE